MAGKKIEFIQKPTSKSAQNFIDNWVSGENIVPQKQEELKRTTIYLPNNLRKELKFTAVKKNTTMTDIILEAINKYLK